MVEFGGEEDKRLTLTGSQNLVVIPRSQRLSWLSYATLPMKLTNKRQINQ